MNQFKHLDKLTRLLAIHDLINKAWKRYHSHMERSETTLFKDFYLQVASVTKQAALRLENRFTVLYLDVSSKITNDIYTSQNN